MKYCDDTKCPQFAGDKCKLGFSNRLRLPHSMADIQNLNWGYVMPKVCRKTKCYEEERVNGHTK